MNGLWVVGSTVVKMLYGIFLYKFIAVTYGVEYLGVTGQLLSLMSILLILSNIGIDRGIIRAYSKNKNDTKKIKELDGACSTVSLISSIIVFLILVVSAKQIATLIFGGEEFTYLIYVLSFIPFFMGINNTIVSIGIAYNKSKLISQSIIIAFVSGLIAVFYLGSQSFDFLLIAVATQGILLFFALVLLNHKIFRKHLSLNWTADTWFEIKKLLSFSLVIIIPVIMMQGALIINRINVLSAFGEFQLGLWEAVVKLQEGYIQIAGVLLIYFMFPKASEYVEEAYSIARKYVAIVFMIFLSAFVVLLIFSEEILALIYNDKTSVMGDNLLILIIGDMFRSLFIVNQYLLLALSRVKLFLILEFFVYSSSVTYVWLISSYENFDYLFYSYLIQSLVLSIISFFAVKRRISNV